MARESRTCFGCVGDCILAFIVVFGLLCLTHDWSKDKGGNELKAVQPVDIRKR